MENLKEGTNDNSDTYVKQDKIVNNFVKSFIILRMMLEVIDTVIRLSNTIQAEEQDLKGEEFYSFSSTEGVEKIVQ